jgi:hypothetical protein
MLAKKRLLLATMNTPTVGMFGGGMAGMPMFGGGMAGMTGMGGMPSYGGVSGGTMGASVSGVYGAMGAPSGGFVAWILPFLLQPKMLMKKKQKKAMTWKMRKCEILSCI